MAGILSKAYGLLDPVLPFDKYLDPRLGRQAQGGILGGAPDGGVPAAAPSGAVPQGAPERAAAPPAPYRPSLVDTLWGMAAGYSPSDTRRMTTMAELRTREAVEADALRRQGREGVTGYFNDSAPDGFPRPVRRAGPDVGGETVSYQPSGQPVGPVRRPPTRALAALGAGGADISSLYNLFSADEQRGKVDGYLETLPEGRRPQAALDPAGFSAWELEGERPVITAVGGGVVGAFDKRTGAGRPVMRAPSEGFSWTEDGKSLAPIARGPADPAYIEEQALARSRGERTGAPPVSTMGIVNSPGDVTGPVLAKVAQFGVEALTPQERQVWDYMRLTRTNPFEESLFGSPPPTGAASAPPPSAAAPPAAPPQRPASPAKTVSRRRDGAFMPQSPEDMQSVPIGSKFVNPSDGRVLTRTR